MVQTYTYDESLLILGFHVTSWEFQFKNIKIMSKSSIVSCAYSSLQQSCEVSSSKNVLLAIYKVFKLCHASCHGASNVPRNLSKSSTIYYIVSYWCT